MSLGFRKSLTQSSQRKSETQSRINSVGAPLTTGQEREVRRRCHEEDHRKAQQEIDLHRERSELRELRRLGRHRRSVLRRGASPSNQSLLTAPVNSPHVQEQDRSQSASDGDAERTISHSRLRQK